jgi:PKD repeat protein
MSWNAFTPIRLSAVALALATASTGCGIDKSSSPAISAPSEFGTSLTLAATPEVLAQDGESQAVISVVARDASSQPISGLSIRWEAVASTSRAMPVTLSASTSVTDAQGRTAIVLTAPPTPTQAPSSPDYILVSATPVAGSVTVVQPRSVMVRLKPASDIAPANKVPVAAFTATPSVGIVNQSVTFDARTTTDEGEPCLGRCTYLWDFGDGSSGTGMVVSHVYAAVGGYPVTLTVVDERDGVGSAQRTFTVNGTDPVAKFTVTPATPHVGEQVVFDASGRSVGKGAVITRSSWNFGDGDEQQTTTPTITKRFDEPRHFPVTLTITTNTGETATFAQTLQVVP